MRMSDVFNREERYQKQQIPPGSPSGGGEVRLQSLEQLGQTSPPPKTEGSNVHVLSIIGQIEGHVLLPPKNKTTKYEHVIPQLVAVEQNPHIEGLLIILNTVGGDIEAGLAIAEMVRSLSKPTVSLVLGGGHSIGTPIAVAATRSFISSTATMTIHPIRLSGMVIGVPQTYEYLDKMQERVIRFIVDHSNVSPEGLREMMFRTGELVRDVGTVLVGREAVQAGLVDEMGGLAEALGYLKRLMAARRTGGVYAQPQYVPPGDAPGQPQPPPPPHAGLPWIPPGGGPPNIPGGMQ